MYLDAFTLSALVDEFMDLLVGGRVQDVLDVDASSIGLEIYANHQRHYLLLSADSRMPRVHLVRERLRRGLPKPTLLGLLMRRFVEGGRITHLSQPPWERVLQIEIEGPEGEVSLIAEPMERRANLLLVREGVILDCLRRVGPEENRYRLSLPNHRYQLPPPMVDRLDPTSVSREDFALALSSAQHAQERAARWFSTRFLGISPLLARELVFRSTGKTDAAAQALDADTAYQVMQTLIRPLVQRHWQPGIAGSEENPEAFSVYPLEHIPGWRPVATISEAMTQVYGAPVGPEAYAEAKKPVIAALDEARRKMQAKLSSLEAGLRDESERDALRQSGELILAYQYTIKAGQRELRAQYEVDGPELVIALDPTLKPLENAQRYLEEYNRAKRAQAGVPRLIAETQTELDYLAQLAVDLELASNWNEIDEVLQALQGRGLAGEVRRRAGGGARSGPLRLVKDGYILWVGRNSRQNDLVTFKHGRPDDWWLHARGVPGAHVVLRNDGRRIPESLLEAAAAIAAHYSASRGEARVLVDRTRCKYVKKIKGGGPGMVTYRNEETISVAPRTEEVLEDA